MTVFRQLFAAAALAGLIAGVFVTLLHMVGTAPIILKAEVYEDAEKAAPRPAMSAMPGHQHEAAGHQHEQGAAWEPANGFERTAYTSLADILTGIGFALLLVSAYALRGHEVDWRQGLYWGLAGFAIFTVAPGIGLPPEVPGTEAAPLLERQLWWVATALATGGGLALIFLARRALWVVAGIALLVLPHIFGAPEPAEYHAAPPPLIAHQFIVAVMVTSLLFWLVLGALTGLFYARFRPAA